MMPAIRPQRDADIPKQRRSMTPIKGMAVHMPPTYRSSGWDSEPARSC